MKLHMPLRKCMRAHTHREFKVADAWLDEQWYCPSRSDYFLMRIAQRVQQVAYQVWGKDASKITLKYQEVFGKSEEPKEESAESIKERTLWSKMRWFGIAGLIGKKKDREK